MLNSHSKVPQNETESKTEKNKNYNRYQEVHDIIKMPIVEEENRLNEREIIRKKSFQVKKNGIPEVISI